MEEIAELLEHEMQSAFEVKDKDSLKRCVLLLARNAVGRREYEQETSGIRTDIKTLTAEIHNVTENMREGFKQVDKRFEQNDKRFDDVNRRFNMMFAFITLGFTILAVLIKFVP